MFNNLYNAKPMVLIIGERDKRTDNNKSSLKFTKYEIIGINSVSNNPIKTSYPTYPEVSTIVQANDFGFLFPDYYGKVDGTEVTYQCSRAKLSDSLNSVLWFAQKWNHKPVGSVTTYADMSAEQFNKSGVEYLYLLLSDVKL